MALYQKLFVTRSTTFVASASQSVQNDLFLVLCRCTILSISMDSHANFWNSRDVKKICCLVTHYNLNSATPCCGSFEVPEVVTILSHSKITCNETWTALAELLISRFLMMWVGEMVTSVREKCEKNCMSV